MARQVYNDTWASGGDKVDPGGVKTTQGWVVEAPPHEHFNYWQGRTDEMLQHLERNGIAEFDASTIYELGGYAREGVVVYRSLAVSNQGNLPSTSPAQWVQAFLVPGNNLSDLADIATARTNLDVYSKGEADANYLPIAGKAADSELLDGIDGSIYARQDQTNTFAANQNIKASAQDTELVLDADDTYRTFLRFKENSVTRGQVYYWQDADELILEKKDTDGTTVTTQVRLRNTGDCDLTIGTLKRNGNLVWDAGNDGAGSGLDADLLDGIQGSSYLRSDADDTFAGELVIEHNLASPIYSDGQLELRTTDGSDASMGWHRSGFTACQLRHELDGLILSGTNRTNAADLHVLGSIKQGTGSGLNVIDTGDVATETFAGLVERATDAEAAAGTDTTRYVTPKQLIDNIASSGGADVDLSNLSATGKDKVATAWVSFDGTNTVSIRDSFNVSSITDNGTGDYTVNFSSNFANANYAWQIGYRKGGTVDRTYHVGMTKGGVPAVGSMPISVEFRSPGGGTVAFVDLAYINVSVFGGN